MSDRGQATTSELSSPPFDTWLDRATRGLCDFAKTQVREEYEDHFTAAYEQLRAEGLDEHEAQVAAVQSLGDARKIRRKLKCVFLTSAEDMRIGWLITSRTKLPDPDKHPLLHEVAKGAVTYAMSLLVALNAYLVATTLYGDWAWFFCGIAILMLIFLGRGFRVPSQTQANSVENLLHTHEQFRLQWAALSLWTFVMLVTVRPTPRTLFDPGFAEAFLIVVVASFGFGFLSAFREFLFFRSILRKLRRYPAQNATPSVLKLRNRLGQPQEPRELD